ncbi:Rne/Rng family ribonuclease [Actinomyces wuliandei]|uniref:Rne/Rng family ribonuclease n=1 Tax=Actinomyces wuliandei TaxID=2057743 RepID=UPI001FAA5F1A|nr:Rne/Rng family ribonuclease [Actinomyces wuliandei]
MARRTATEEDHGDHRPQEVSQGSATQSADHHTVSAAAPQEAPAAGPQDKGNEEPPRLPAASLLFQAPDPSRARRRRRVTQQSVAPDPAPAASRRAATALRGGSGAQQQEPTQDRDSQDPAADGAGGTGGSVGGSFSGPGSSSGPRRGRRRAAAEEWSPQGEEEMDDSTGSGTRADAARADEGEQPEQTEQAESSGSRRRRRGSRGRRSRSRTGADAEAVDSSSQDSQGRSQDRGGTSSREPGDTGREAAEDVPDASEDSSTSSVPRRRRRSRTRTEPGREARDEVTALKGSTRLEAKRQRRREGRAAGRRRSVVTEAEFLARRESVDRQMIVREADGLNQIAVLEDGLLVEHYVARHTQTSMVGNVYMGRVQNVLPSMEAAFIDLGKGRNAVLYAGEVDWEAADAAGRPRRIEDALSSGDTVLVQVTKDPIGHKGARLTSQVTLAGRYLVLVPGGSMTGISRKLPDTERSRLRKILQRVVPESAGVIVRTAAEGASEDQLAADVARLVSQWEAIDKKAASVRKGSTKVPVLLKGEPELAVRVVRDVFNEDFRRLVVSGSTAWKTISGYVNDLSPDLADRLEHWTSPEDVFSAHRVDEQLAKGFDRKVWLPSGGTLVIDRTEAMTVIDVNTGRFTGAGGTLEETVTRNNLEAAEEIVRQLRLRDIGGMIVIDFVDMVLESNRDLVLRRLVECLGRDRTRHQVTEVTSLGLVQMTRKRVGQGLVEAFSTTCETCRGRGFIVHDEPVENQQVDMSASASRGAGKGRGRRSRETGSGRDAARASTSGSKAADRSAKEARQAGPSDQDQAKDPGQAVSEVSPVVSVTSQEEARSTVRGALAQIAAATEQAHQAHGDSGNSASSSGDGGSSGSRTGAGTGTQARRPRRRRVVTTEVTAPQPAAPSPAVAPTTASAGARAAGTQADGDSAASTVGDSTA